MDFLIEGLLVLVLAVTLANGQHLERETRRQFCQMKDLLAELNGGVAGANASLGEVRRGLSRLEDQLKKEEKAKIHDIAGMNKVISSFCNCMGEIYKALDRLTGSVKEPQSYEDSKQISAALQRMEANMNILREAVSRTADNMQDMSHILAAMQEVEADFDERLEKLRRETPEPLPSDDEAKHSRAIEEGIVNLLQYQVGKGKKS